MIHNPIVVPLTIAETAQHIAMDVSSNAEQLSVSIGSIIPIIPMTVAESAQQYSLGVNSSVEEFAVGLATAIQVVTGRHYSGPIEVTPTDHDVVLDTAGMFTDDQITVHAIPSNYGLITWNGSSLTVS